MSKKHNIKLVCTNDVHFVNEEDAEAHDRLICVSTGTFLDDDKRMLYTKQEWMKTQEEMNELFADNWRENFTFSFLKCRFRLRQSLLVNGIRRLQFFNCFLQIF
jgi:DNA polymerase III alpha subunit